MNRLSLTGGQTRLTLAQTSTDSTLVVAAVGPQGVQGEQGDLGPVGPRGSIWYSGAGAPTNDVGIIDDYYLDSTNGQIYRKGATTWGSPILAIPTIAMFDLKADADNASFTGSASFNTTGKIINLADPSANQDGATKKYVDDTLAGAVGGFYLRYDAAQSLTAAQVQQMLDNFGGAVWRTGNCRLTLQTTATTGWILANDGNIGDALSGGTTRANADTQNLFLLMFTNFSDALAPIFTSSGTPTTRVAQTNGATAWAAHCRISVPKLLGRALGIAGTGAGLTARTLGQTLGEEEHTQTLAELVQHRHTMKIGATGPTPFLQAGSNFATDGGDGFTGYEGGGDPFNIMQPTSFMNLEIKL